MNHIRVTGCGEYILTNQKTISRTEKYTDGKFLPWVCSRNR